MNACTIVARNYVAFARVLARSFLAHHQGGQFAVLVLDDEARELDDEREPFRVVRLEDLGLPIEELHTMAMLYNVTELATALKPALLQLLLREGCDHIIYLDPDVEVLASFPEVAGLAREHGVVLTPHVLEPMPRDTRFPGESQIMISGMFNLGFIAVSGAAVRFLAWWAERLARHAVIDPCNGLFTDQRWVDFVPVLFDHHVIRDPGFNVAYWNVFQRPLTRWDGGYRAGGATLRFFHYSGFDVKKPHLLSKHMVDRPRTLLSEDRLLAELCRDYAAKLRCQGHDEATELPYGFDTLPNGWDIDPHMRHLYRRALLDDQADEAPKSPFLPGSLDSFIAWLQQPEVVDHARTQVSRYLASHWQSRLDLQVAFPRLVGEDAERFRRWAANDEGFAGTVPGPLRETRLVSTLGTPPTTSAGCSHNGRLVPGVSIAGYFQAQLGVGQAGRLLVAGVEEAGLPFSTVTYDRTLSPQEHPFQSRRSMLPFDVNILCVNADQTPTFVRDMGRAFTEGRYNIGVWFWEVESFPSEMHEAFDHVDEVWVASEFTREAVAAHTSKPVHLVPLPVMVPGHMTRHTRADLGLPDGFLFHFSFDFFSVSSRKNPVAVVEAFKDAFEAGEGAALIVKSINGSHNLCALEELRMAAAGRPDVHVVDRCLPAGQVRALNQLVDCTVSLHRSEGFGLTLAEAMACAKPVIATGYSGNLAFMDEENSFLVPYDLVPVGPHTYPYPAESRWAEPDMAAAVRLMRQVFDDRDGATERGQLGLASIRSRHDIGRTAEFVARRLSEIRSGNGAPPAGGEQLAAADR